MVRTDFDVEQCFAIILYEKLYDKLQIIVGKRKEKPVEYFDHCSLSLKHVSIHTKVLKNILSSSGISY